MAAGIDRDDPSCLQRGEPIAMDLGLQDGSIEPEAAGHHDDELRTTGPGLLPRRGPRGLAGAAEGGHEGATRPDGARSSDNQILATYVHGLFDTPEACTALLRWAGLAAARTIDYPALREASLERLADTLAASLDLEKMFGLIA